MRSFNWLENSAAFWLKNLVQNLHGRHPMQLCSVRRHRPKIAAISLCVSRIGKPAFEEAGRTSFCRAKNIGASLMDLSASLKATRLIACCILIRGKHKSQFRIHRESQFAISISVESDRERPPIISSSSKPSDEKNFGFGLSKT